MAPYGYFSVFASLLGLVCFPVFAEAQLKTVVLPPVSQGTELCLIIIPGAEIPGELYRPVAEAIQRFTPAELWVGLTAGFAADTPNPLQLSDAIDLALADLKAAGMSRFGVPTFMAGHSLGGTFVQDYVASNANQVSGLLLWGSYLTGTNRVLADYPVPVMHLSGDLDGLTRITRLADVYSEMDALEATNPGSQFRYPVVLLEGVNHGQFASGDMPPNVVANDIPSNLTFTEAHDLIGQASADFIMLTFAALPDQKDRIEKGLEGTGELLVPLMKAKSMEQDGEMSPWVLYAQEMVINVPKDLADRLIVKNNAYSGLLGFAESKPSVTKEATGVVTVKSRAKTDLPRNLADISLVEQSANEIAGKMKRQEAVREVLGGERYNDTVSCQEINMMALKWALGEASSVARSRYGNQGRQMQFNSDILTLTGSSWLSGKLRLTYTPTGDLVVTSVVLLTPAMFPIQSIAGMQYCKLLSPYRAMEWIYVDSLRPYQGY
ncbi:uncharacterized protein LOC119730686 [Patiria miniata]|uniref:Alpha/beta hydrolase n=1 Tax=Patiria miniata TaxID=46514 RepID=A0A914A6W7_PATMI|nr:uncharacterized protein LOC119730686 [Patiria miniata]